jgi:hypothetical protein
LFLQKCNTFKEFKSFILTSDSWADERAVAVLAGELEINILVKDTGYGVNASTGVNPDRKKTVILQRTGQHFNAMHKKGTQKFVFDTNGKIVRSMTGMSGGGDDVKTDEAKVEPEGSDDEAKVEPEGSDDEAKVEPEGSDDANSPTKVETKVPAPAKKGGRKRSKRNKKTTGKTRKIVVHTDTPF